MYKFSDFDTVQELPNVVNMKELSEAVGLSLSRTYELVSEMKMQVFQTGKKKFMFKDHILQCFDGCPFYTPVAELKAIRGLPRVFNPKYLMVSLISHPRANYYCVFICTDIYSTVCSTVTVPLHSRLQHHHLLL